ncbi:unnamed protein product [Hymenolepis diminuta]|uniref:Reverse transcriptase/retrotransposon-derived protein RNase H-like domain-containing protein n=1 Tax=Hymenolepis diminuta TaxID=6216 RepID=A0A564YN32_HYMDI|nr:unnamed protein product [Hymenolepis diminuta]
MRCEAIFLKKAIFKECYFTIRNINLMDLDWIDEFNLIQLPDENETYQTPTPEPTNAKNLQPPTVLLSGHGQKSVTLDLGLSRIFRWIFIVADISEPTIGSDFRCHFGLLLDLRIKNPLSPLSLKISLTSPTRFSDKPVNHSVTHSITTHGNPVKARVRHLSPTLCKIAKDEFEHMLDLGIFRRSFSNWSFVLYLVSKKYGDWRPCGDYCALNSIRVPENYPLPNTQDFSSYLRNKKIFSKINLVRAYNRIPVAEADIRKTVITISFGIINFYCRSLPNSAIVIFPLTELLKSAKANFSFPPEAVTAIEEVKILLTECSTPVYQDSEIAVGAVLEQRTGGKAQPLVFFSAKLIPIQPHMQVGEIRYLDYYLQFTNNIRHVKGSDNIAAGCLSRTNAEAVTKAVDFRSIFKAQKSSKLQEFRNPALIAHCTPERWTPALPLVLPGIQTAVKDDLNCSAAEMVSGVPLKLPGQFLSPSNNSFWLNPINYVERLRSHMQNLQALPTRPVSNPIFISNDLKTCSHVFLRQYDIRKPLQPIYEGPSKRQKDFHFPSKWQRMDRIKPAYLDKRVTENSSFLQPSKDSLTPEQPLISGVVQRHERNDQDIISHVPPRLRGFSLVFRSIPRQRWTGD